MELITGKAKEAFEKWWHINRSADIWNYENSTYTIFDFYSLHNSMRDGVIIDWLDSVVIYVETFVLSQDREIGFCFNISGD